ncbi:MAG TPA: hypothetical protein VGR82_20755 [Methylomirabilota bacterium]|jgi:hypothetical protein|nr:hypothetical protein [Methylomirabilota bacterium]
MGNASHLAALMLLFGAATADAQVTPPATAAGSYQQLSVGNQKIARALFEAQVQPTTTTVTPGARRPLTLDQIAAMKQNGTGWGQVFQQMQAKGLVSEKNLGQVVSRYNTSHMTSPSASVATTVSNRPTAAGHAK